MYHTIQFIEDLTVDVETVAMRRLERMCLHQGTRRRAQIKPYVVETLEGPVEVADLFFEDGTARKVPFASFHFAD